MARPAAAAFGDVQSDKTINLREIHCLTFPESGGSHSVGSFAVVRWFEKASLDSNVACSGTFGHQLGRPIL